MPTEEELFIAEVRDSFTNGKLEYLVGAGPSIAAGVPTWNELNLGLLKQFLGAKYQDLELRDADLRAISTIFVDRFGREAVVDLIRSKAAGAGVPEFEKLLGEALYGGRELSPSTLHYELSAALESARKAPHKPAGIFTLNYDNLISEAAEELTGSLPTAVFDGVRPKTPHVVHLHGYFPKKAAPVQGTLILSETDYHMAAQGDWAEKQLVDVLTNGNQDVLLVGLSLSDPRLRRLFLQRIRKGWTGKVFAFLPESRCDDDEDLIQRLAHNFVRRHEREFWVTWKLKVLHTRHHEFLPLYLRQIRLGSDTKEWTKRGHEFLKAKCDLDKLYKDTRQREIDLHLINMATLIRRRFGIQQGEEFYFGGFVAWEAGKIRLGFRYRGEDLGRNTIDSAEADKRTLDVSSLSTPQGAAGYAFLHGTVVEAPRNSPQLNANFTQTMIAEWSKDRPFASLQCIPVYDSAEWVPIGVVYFSSTAAEPFWARLGVCRTNEAS
jgi:hypothetical protein